MKKIYSAASVFLLLALAGTLRAQEAQALVEGFLRDVAAPAHGLGSEDCRFVLTDNYPTHHSGLTHLYVNQTYQGIKIHNAITSVAVQDGKIVHWANRFLSGVAARATAVAPGLSPEEAVFYAAAHLGVKPSGEMALQDAGDPKSPRYTFVGSGISRENITVELCYQPVGDSLVLAWNVNIDDVRNPDWWNIRVDARTGAFLEKDNWTVRCHFDGPEHAHDCRAHLSEEDFWVKKENGIFSDIPEDAPMAGSYRVFAPPLESPNHGSRTLVSNPDDALASPYGWHDTNGANGAEYTITRGNNVWASEDADNNNVPGYSPNGGATLTFDHALNLAQAPSTYQDPAITNLFFWNNFVHDVLYHYGFDEPGGNFQANNYGRGGTANDAVVADAQDGSGTNNANFSTPPDGQSGRMQMFVWTNTNPNRDSDLDNGVIAHEYGHGVSTRLTGGPANSSCLNNEEQMGEGWSDWLALVLTIEPNDAGPNMRGIGTYLMGQPVTGVGIRNYPYSTNLAVNPVTYDNIKTFSVPHGVGSVWCSMLWDMTWALIDRYGFDPDMYNGNGGNNVAIRLVLDAMKLQPCNPGFVDGRDAILQADMLNYGGANRCLIWEAFANRGLGFSAVQGSTNSRADGTQAFDLPTFCTTPVTAPTAQFSVNSQINCFGDFSFTDQSANIPTAWLWNFGDGNTSTTINPTHSYAAPGTYTVVLTVTNQFGTDTATASVTYTSVTPPNLSIAGNLSLCPGVSSQLDANDGVGNNTPWTYTWNNGGNTRIVTVVNPGTYTVSINDGAGCTATAGATLTNLPAPLAEIVSTRPGGACSLPVNLESSGSCGNSYTVTTFANNFATCLANAGPTGDDVAGGPYNIGFNFKFYGQTFTQFSIATNGVIQLGGGAISTFWEDSPFPNNTFTSAIALAWDDWVATSGDITYGTTGTAPNRRLIVCFNNMTHATEASTLTSGRIILYESTNVVELHLTCNSSSATQGFQLNSGTGVTIRSGALVSTDARRITPNPCNTYAWSNGATVSGITASISGTYALTVTDVSGCTATASVPVSVPTATIAPVPLVANCANFSTTLMANNTDCNDFVGYNTATTISNNFVACGANAGPSGDDAASGPHPIGFTFMYYGQPMTQFGIVTNGFIQFGAGPYSTNAANVPLPSNILGSAIALVWDDWVADPGDITYQTVGSAPNRQLVVCFNNIVHFSGGGRVINNGRIILYESTNVFEVHLDGNQTSGTQGYQLNSGTGTTIRNGSFTSTNARRVTPTPTCTYAWSTGATTASIAANSPGTYVVTTTDGQGCTASASASFIPVNATLTGGTNFCDQGTLTANVSGGTAPFAYSWSNGRTTAANAVNSSGTYSLSITDAGGCSTTLTTNVTVNPRPTLSATSTGASCNGNNGSVNLSVTGTGPFGFGWNNGATTEDLGGLAAGSYTVTVQGAGGCTATAAATVGTLPDAVAPTFSVCPGSQTLSMGANCGAALPNYLPNAAAADNCGTPTVTQSPAPGTAVAGIGNTTVTLVATDASGNTASCSFTVQRTGGTPLATATPTSPGCGGGTGSISLSVTGGATPYTYLWNDGTTAVNRTGLAAGTYAVTATDACGSTATAAANIIFTAVSAAATGTATPCNANSGAVNLTLGGNGPFAYTWNNGATTEDLGGLAAGSYTVTVQGAGGCTATASATVGTLPDAVAPTFSVCPGNSDTMSTVSIALPDFTAFAAASDNCGTPNLQQVPAAGTVYAQSQNVTITMTATDASGNSTVCTFTYQIGIFSCLPVGNVIYVNDNATGANNGDSWQNAFTDLQNGLAAAAAGDQIWVAEGTYYPGSQPSSVFDLRAGVAMYGGFPDNLTCPDLQVRDWNSYPTVLSGDIGVPGDASDNCARILQANNIGSSTIVDGFRIASGNAPIQGAGLGITANNGVSSPAFENCTFSGNSAGNRGAAVYVFATASGQAAPTFVNCIFSQNNSTTEGGAIAAISQLSGVLGLSISGGQFIGNTSQRGGALSANAVSGGTLSLQVTETQFEANSATSNGGAIWLNGRSGGTLQYSVQDAQFNGNTAQNGAAMFAQTLGSSMTGTVARSRFTANQSTGYAALTIYAEKGVPVNGLAVENCIFESNKSGRGGGLAAVSLSGGRTNAQVRSSLFRGNSGVGGGALFTAQNANAQTAGAIENSVFASNTSFSKGGGLVAQALNGGVTNIQVSFCDFYANLSGYGGSAANLVQGASNSNISLNNSIFSENVTLFLGAKNFHSEGAGAVTSLQSSIVEQALCANNHSGTGTFSCSGIVAQNPGWSDPVNGDFSLLPNSPAIDQAVSGPSSDFNGNPRPAGAGYDWGAFEWQTPAAPARMSAPKNALSAAIFPNPNAGNFSVLFDRAVTGMLQVFDARGAMVAAQNVTGVDRAEMDLGKLPAGPYWVRIVADSEVLTLVVVLQKP